MPELPPQTEMIPPHKPFTKKFLIWLIVILAVAGTAYGGIWFWNDKNKEAVGPTFTPRPDPMADWKTYRNEEYGFEFRYPGEMFKIGEQRATLNDEPYLSDKSGRTVIQLDRSGWTIYPGNLGTHTFEGALLNSELGDGLGVSRAKIIEKEYISDNKTNIYTESVFEYNDGSFAKSSNIRADFLKGIMTYKDSLRAHDVITMELKEQSHKDVFKKIISTAKLTESGWKCEGVVVDKCPSGYVCKHSASFPTASGNCIRAEQAISSFTQCVASGFWIRPTNPETCQSSEGLIFTKYDSCIQVITPARNPQTGETRDFPTPCDVPEGWMKI